MSLIVISHHSDPNQSQSFRESAERHGVPLAMLGYHDDAHAPDLVAFIRQRPEDYVILTDAFDVLVSRWDAAEVESLISAETTGILHSCESDCWPSGPWSASYPEPHGIWFAINGGQSCGSREAIAAMIEENQKYVSTAGGGNQERYHRMRAAGYPMGLDTECRIFQSMSGRSSSLVECRDGQMYNTVTRTFPMFGHWNGRTDIGAWTQWLA